MTAAQANQENVRLRLIFESPELAALPWEFLYDEDTNVFLYHFFIKMRLI
ncbi:hypothetical protein Riv7116_0211 [Rivularia sp. PCC 7116]|nr:hypothetical protein [Rivularia sp. PCC 7116]AFY52818.1 hypothetical protein Riv7116_0211 [Rivularia sp. PCC 7116]